MPPLDIISVTIGCDTHHYPSPPITTHHRYCGTTFSADPGRLCEVYTFTLETDQSALMEQQRNQGGFHSHGGYPWKIHGKSKEWLVYFEDPMTNYG